MSRQSTSDALVKKSTIHDAHAAYVQQLRVPDDANDEEIQQALERLSNKNTKKNQESVLKMSTTTEEQGDAGILDNTRPSGQAETDSRSVQYSTIQL